MVIPFPFRILFVADITQTFIGCVPCWNENNKKEGRGRPYAPNDSKHNIVIQLAQQCVDDKVPAEQGEMNNLA